MPRRSRTPVLSDSSTLFACTTSRFVRNRLFAWMPIALCGFAWGQDPSETVELEPFTVVGSRLLVTEMAGASNITPVQILGTDDFERLGFSTTTELIQSLPVNNGGAIPVSNSVGESTRGASSLSLRGLGPEATLVLLNGRRVAPFPLGEDGTTALVDLNSFPLASIERVEVLKDGASSIYGADAVAGVVNLVTRRDFVGTELSLRYGNTTNEDSSDLMMNAVSGFEVGESHLTVGFNYSKRNRYGSQ